MSLLIAYFSNFTSGSLEFVVRKLVPLLRAGSRGGETLMMRTLCLFAYEGLATRLRLETDTEFWVVEFSLSVVNALINLQEFEGAFYACCFRLPVFL